MHVLWLATKPPWPTVDGGRLVAARTIEGLLAEGHRVTVVTPVDPGAEAIPSPASDRLAVEAVPVRRPPAAWDAVRALVARRPWTIERHDLAAVRRRAARVVERGPVDIVHAEQIQALASAAELPPELPVVLRAQNVESDLWLRIAEHRPLLAPWLRREARRLAAVEADAVRRLAATVALTPDDAARLEILAGSEVSVHAVPAPVDPLLDAGLATLDGDPPLVLFGSAGWRPNRDGAAWFAEEIWPAIRGEHPDARLHAFGFDGLGGDAVVEHPAPAESREALADGAVLVVPLHVASGVRMKILEAWARAVPVIATSVAARGLGATPGRELWIADDPASAVEAVTAARDPERRAAVVRAGRERLAAEHAPEVVARKLATLYADAIARR